MIPLEQIIIKILKKPLDIGGDMLEKASIQNPFVGTFTTLGAGFVVVLGYVTLPIIAAEIVYEELTTTRNPKENNYGV